MCDARYAVRARHRVISFVIRQYCLHIDAQATLHGDGIEKNPIMSKDQMVQEVIKHCKGKHCRYFDASFPECQDIIGDLINYKRAVDMIEEAVVSPYTKVGKQRLMREFHVMLKSI